MRRSPSIAHSKANYRGINNDEVFLFGVSNKKCQQLCGLGVARVLAQGVMNARSLRPAFTGMEDLSFAVIESAAIVPSNTYPTTKAWPWRCCGVLAPGG
jgi:hypothetical protein